MATKSRTIQLIIAGKDRMSKIFKSVGNGLKKLGVGALKVTAGLTAGAIGATAAFAALYNKMAASIDEQAKVASSLGIANKALGAMRDAAGYAGISNDSLTTSLKKMSQGIADAVNGIGEAKDALSALNLDAAKLQKMNPEDAFAAIITELDKIPNGIKKTGLAMDLFGRSGAAMANLTAKGLRQAQNDADTLGIKLTTAQAAGVEAANDAWARIKNAGRDFLQYLTATIAPKIEAGFKKAFEFLKTQDLKSWADQAGNAIISVASIAAKSLPKALLLILEVIGKIGMGIRGWQMLWQEAKIQGLAFSQSVQNILKFIAEGFRQIFTWVNFGGVFDGAINGLQDFVNNQDAIIKQLERDRVITVKEQLDTVKDYNDEQAAIDGYKKNIQDLENQFKKLGTVKLEESQQAVEAHTTEAEAVAKTTSEYQKQEAVIRRLNNLKTAGGTFNVAGGSSNLEGFAKQLEDEATK